MPPGGDDDGGTAATPVLDTAMPATDTNPFVGGQMGAVLHNPPLLLDTSMTAAWETMVARHNSGILHDPG